MGLDKKRSYVVGKFMMNLDGGAAGWIQSIEGGNAEGDVVAEKVGTDLHQYKHIGNVKYTDVSMTCGTGMSGPFYDWIWGSFTNKYARKNGSIIGCDFGGNAQSELSFFEALITEFGMPALDAASKDAAKMTLKFKPEKTRMKAASGKLKGEFKSEVQKRWMPSNFRLKIDGLDDMTKRVSKVEALVVKQKVVESPCGELREYESEPASLELPNLVITVAESHAKDLYTWHEDFVIKGNCGQDKEKSGTLEYLTPDLQTPLFTLTFKGLGIFKCAPDKLEGGGEKIRSVKAEMYLEHIDFKYDGKAKM